MKISNNTNGLARTSLRRIFIYFLIYHFFFPAIASAECLIEKAAFWDIDDPTKPFYEIKKQIAHEACMLSETQNCPELTLKGKYGSALKFDGQSGVTIEHSDVFEWSAEDSFSIEFWMKRDNSPMNNNGNEVIIGRDDGAKEGMHWWVGLNWQGLATAYLRDKQDGHLVHCGGNKLLTDDKWHHIVFVRDSRRHENRLYVDGHLESLAKATYRGSDAFKSFSAKLNFGWINMDHFYQYKGLVDEIAIYPLALPEWYVRSQYDAKERYGSPCE